MSCIIFYIVAFHRFNRRLILTFDNIYSFSDETDSISEQPEEEESSPTKQSKETEDSASSEDPTETLSLIDKPAET
jgi:hypothetical protein